MFFSGFSWAYLESFIADFGGLFMAKALLKRVWFILMIFFLLFGYSCNDLKLLEDFDGDYYFVTCRLSEEELPGEDSIPGLLGHIFLWIGLNISVGEFVSEVIKRLAGSPLGDMYFPGESSLSSLLRSKE